MAKGVFFLIDVEHDGDVQQCKSLIIENLAVVIDLNVENNKVDDYNAKVMDFLMLS